MIARALWFLGVCAALGLSHQARAGEVLIDARTGALIAGAEAEAPRFPASVTKLMTIHLALEAVAAGRLSLGAELTVSAHAAAAPPVRLGLRAGETITLEQAIHAALTRSSNDAARVIAEAVAGDEATFAHAMTEAGRAMGLTATAFRNATGLPDPRHVSTTLDMARLAAVVHQAHGRTLSRYFRRALVWRGRSLGPRNGTVAASLLGKTGFTCAAGYTAAMVVETAEGPRALATSANPGAPQRAESLRRLRRGDVRERAPRRGCGAARASRVAVAPAPAPRAAPLKDWALTLGVFEEPVAARARLEAGRAALDGVSGFALGRRGARAGVYALFIARSAEEAVRRREALRAAGLPAQVLSAEDARLLGLSVLR